MLEIYKATGDECYYNTFLNSIEWYKKAMRKDGGFFRATYVGFNTDSFGHATSGTACVRLSVFSNIMNTLKTKPLLSILKKG